MISLCTVNTDFSDKYLYAYKESILERTTQVSEVNICDLSAGPSSFKETVERGITFRTFGIPMPKFADLVRFGHPLGLHECIKRATQEYVLLCDPDLFFYKGADETYLDLYNKYDLSFIGISHHCAINNCCGYFPYIGNLLIKKTKLPRDDYLDNFKHLRTMHNGLTENEVKGKYLMMDLIPEIMNLYPNPSGHCDSGFHLWYWCHLEKKHWLAFQTTNVHLYTTRFYKSDIRIKDRFPEKKLVWHATGGGGTIQPYWEEFQKAYEQSKNE